MTKLVELKNSNGIKQYVDPEEVKAIVEGGTEVGAILYGHDMIFIMHTHKSLKPENVYPILFTTTT